MFTIRTGLGLIASILCSALLLAAAGGHAGNGNVVRPPPTPTGFSVGGNIANLNGTVILQNNATDDLSVSGSAASTPFTFATRLPREAEYAVSVKTQPANQICTVTNGSGFIVADVTNVAVTCSNLNRFAVSVVVTGLTGTTLVLQNNMDVLTVNAAGRFTFGTQLANGTPYDVRVRTQASFPAHDCSVASGSGVINGANVTVTVNCTLLPTVTQPHADTDVFKAHAATVAWSGGAGATYNLYLSTARHCDIRNFGICPGGRVFLGVLPPQTVTGLSNGQPYFFQVETVFANGARDVSGEFGARPNVPAFDSTVLAMARPAGGKTFVGGLFKAVGVTNGSAVPLDDITGRLDRADFPIVVGRVNAVAADGSGGWYLGGRFTRVGNTARSFLAHVLADGTVDAGFPQVSGEVNAIATAGTTVYVGGGFDDLGGHRFLAKIDRGTVVAAWNPQPDAPVRALALSPDGTRVYAGGAFMSLGSIARRGLAALDAATGIPVASFLPNPAGIVHALAVSPDATVVYVGGDFSTIAGSPYVNLAALDAASGLILPGFRRFSPDADVTALAVAGEGLYVGGFFRRFSDGQGLSFLRQRLASITARTGELRSWNADTDGPVEALAVIHNSLYVGGFFTNVAGQPRHSLAAIDASGAVLPWAPEPYNEIAALAGDGNNTVYAGGTFRSVHNVARSGLVAFEPDGSLSTAAPQVNEGGAVFALAASGTSLHVGGQFTTIGGVPRMNHARINSDGSVDVASRALDPDKAVQAIAIAGTNIYLGGDFVTISNGAAVRVTRRHVAKLFEQSGRLFVDGSFNPDTDGINGAVYTILPTTLAGSGTPAVYLGGDFRSVRGANGTRQNGDGLALVSADFGIAVPISTSDPTPKFRPAPDGIVFALAQDNNNLYVGGSFHSMRGIGNVRTVVDNLAQVSATDGVANPFAPINFLRPNSVISTFAQSPTTLYFGGDFTNLGTQRQNVAAVLKTGELVNFAANPNGGVTALMLSDGNINIGGEFTELGGSLRGAFGVVDANGVLVP